MKYRFLLVLLLFVSFSGYTQSIRSLSFEELKSEIAQKSDTLLILNFWATWCKPCIEEIPWFEQTAKDQYGQKVKLILVNLDFNSKVQSIAVPFIQKKKIESTVWHINDTDPNSWINQVDSTWSGAIPATVMYRMNKKVFFKEGTVSEKTLREEILKNLNP